MFGLGEAAVLFGKIAVVNGLCRAAVVFLHIAAGANPLGAQCRQPLLHRAFEVRIAPRTGAIIDAHRLILLDGAGVRPGGREFDFAQGHADIGVDLPRDVNAFALGQLFGTMRGRFDGARRAVGQPRMLSGLRYPCGFERIFGRDHKTVDG